MQCFKVLFLFFLLLNGCGKNKPESVNQVPENKTDNNQQQVNKEILAQLRDLREQTTELKNQISSRDTNNNQPLSNSGKPSITAQSVQMPTDEVFEDVNLVQHPINTAAAIGDLSRVIDILKTGYDINTKIEGNTPLHNAVSNGRIEIVEYLIANNADINLTNSNGDNSLDLAYAFSRNEIIEILKSNGLKRKPENFDLDPSTSFTKTEDISKKTDNLDVERKAYDSIINNDVTGINLALENGFNPSKRFDNLIIQDADYPKGVLPISLALDAANVEVLGSLIKNGAKVVHDKKSGDMPLIRSMTKFAEAHDTKNNESEVRVRKIIDVIINNNPMIVNKGDGESYPIFYAVTQRDIPLLKKLINNDVNINIRDANGLTPLIISLLPNNDHSHDGENHSHTDFSEIARILIDSNANIKLRGNKGEDPLILACFGGYDDIVADMIEKNADVNYVDPTGLSPIVAALVANDHIHMTATEVDSHGHQVEISHILMDNGADVTVKGPYGENIIELVSRLNSVELFKKVISLGAKLQSETIGRNIFINSVKNENIELMNYLVESGVDFDFTSSEGRSPLHISARIGSYESSKFLIDKGANINKPIQNGPFIGDHPLDEAYASSNSEKHKTIKLLKDNGAESGRK